MSTGPQQLEAAIAALEAQRAILGDEVVEALLAPARAKLAALVAPAAAPAASEPAQALRQVSILFLDVVGSTTLSQHLDPEAVSTVMDDALARGTAIVVAHRGKVLQYAGDNILAAFGADEVREDDAERAVLCGLALLELGKALGAEVLAAHGHAGFDVRVGIHTGGVLLGGGVDAEGSIRGSAVNVAARMEQTAPAGHLRISHETHAQVRGMFEVDAQAPLALKGVDTPMRSYLVRRAKPRSFRIGTRGIEGVATKMVGRDLEFGVLQEAFRRLFVDPRLAAVTVVADAGIGKSRLLYEFEAWSQTRPEAFLLFRGRATPQTGGQAFGLLRDILAWRFQIADDDSIEAARVKMEQGIVPLFLQDDGPELAEGHAHLLGHLIGIEWRDSRHIRGILDDPRQIRNRAFHAAAQLFRRLSARSGAPVVVQLEDLHWADNESLDFLAYLGEVNLDVPMLLLAFCRPALLERRGDWLGGSAPRHRIDLQALDRAASRELAGELLQKLPDVPAALRELLTGGAEGNPFYMEELVKMLIDQGAIDAGQAGPWRLHAERLLATRVPGTLTGVLQARLDGLPAPEKLALQEASVIGPVFWDQALLAVDGRAREILPALVRRELALPRADAMQAMGGDDLREYAFRHQILHQVTYDTVLKRSKRDWHGRVAAWLARLSGLRARDFLGATAEHYERAGDVANAAEFHARAAEHAGERFGHDAVLSHVAKALALLGPPGEDAAQAPLRWRLLTAREKTLDLQARRDEQAADIEAMSRLADRQDDDRQRAYASWRRSGRAMRMADWAGCETAARSATALAEQASEPGLRLHSLRLLALARAFQDDVEAGKALARQGLADARERGLRTNEAYLLNALAVMASLQADVMATLELSRENLLIYSEMGDRRNEAVALANLGAAWLNLGQGARAQQYLDQALPLLRANGDRLVEGTTLSLLSELALWQNDAARALALARSALEIATSAQARDREVEALLRRGDAEAALGQFEQAEPTYRRALALAVEIDSPWLQAAHASMARVALARGDNAAALQAIAPLMAEQHRHAAAPDATSPRAVELVCYQVLSRAGAAEQRLAQAWLSSARQALQSHAATIPDAELREAYLHGIPTHREILQAWAGHDSAAG